VLRQNSPPPRPTTAARNPSAAWRLHACRLAQPARLHRPKDTPYLFGQLEVTFEEVQALSASKPSARGPTKQSFGPHQCCFGLFSLVTLWAHDFSNLRKLKPRTSARYPKAALTFSDAITAVRRENMGASDLFHVAAAPGQYLDSALYLRRMENALAYAAPRIGQSRSLGRAFKQGASQMQKIRPFLWVRRRGRGGDDVLYLHFQGFEGYRRHVFRRRGSGSEGTVMSATFELNARNSSHRTASPPFNFSPAVSFFVSCDTQEEIDELWDNLAEGGEPTAAVGSRTNMPDLADRSDGTGQDVGGQGSRESEQGHEGHAANGQARHKRSAAGLNRSNAGC